jgi:GNAT superfamily N-acetyltransferase
MTLMALLDLPNGYYDLPKGKLANVVTCLEMRAAPDRALRDLPQDVDLIRVDGADLAGYRQVFAAVGSDLLWFSRMLMTDDRLASVLNHPQVDSFVLWRAAQAIGLLELNFDHPTDCELAFFGLLPRMVGHGMGRALMDEALRRAWARPITRLWVHTCTFDSPQALPFYIRSGFVVYQRMVEIHDDPRLLGKLSLDAAPQVPIL